MFFFFFWGGGSQCLPQKKNAHQFCLFGKKKRTCKNYSILFPCPTNSPQSKGLRPHSSSRHSTATSTVSTIWAGDSTSIVPRPSLSELTLLAVPLTEKNQMAATIFYHYSFSLSSNILKFFLF